jgi:hypothetical protein
MEHVNAQGGFDMSQDAMGNMFYPGMGGMGNMEPQQKELTPEEQAEIETQRKEAERKARKHQIESLKKSIKSKNLSIKIAELTVVKFEAEKDVLVNVELKDAPTEWHKKAIRAEVAEIEAVIEQSKYSIEQEKEGSENMKTQLADLEKKDKEDGSASQGNDGKGSEKHYL